MVVGSNLNASKVSQFFGNVYSSLKFNSVPSINAPVSMRYIDAINDILVDSKNKSNMYILENYISISKLLNHEDSKFKELIKERQLKVKVYTWKIRENEKNIEELLRIDNIETFIIPKEEIQHYTLIDKPKMGWFEAEHKEHINDAHDCILAKGIYKVTWDSLIELFSNLEKTAIKN